MRAGRAIWLPVLVVTVAGCSRGARSVEVPAGAGAPPELGSSLQVRVAADSVRFELHITNTTGGPVMVSFPSAQRYDVVVTRGNGEEVWRMSEGQMFAQVTGLETLRAGETKRYTATWIAREQSGDYVATAVLTSDNYPVELRTVFRLPGT